MFYSLSSGTGEERTSGGERVRGNYFQVQISFKLRICFVGAYIQKHIYA